ncbi:MAG: hypothetical protein HYY25_15280 [Candidatus Wallbacteria bacterium]|nr:hypothetical protein [Candidatus Wallbacteria bacterium]
MRSRDDDRMAEAASGTCRRSRRAGGWPIARRRVRSAFALAIIVGVLVIVLFIAFVIHSLSRAELRLTTGFVDHQMAFQLAEAGLEQALFALKSDLATNRGLLAAIEGETPTEIDFGRGVTHELESLVESPSLGDVFLWARYDPEQGNAPNIGDYRVGRLTVRSQGVYTNAQGYQARRQVKMVTKVTGINLGIVAPDHGLFVRDPLPVEYRVPSLAFDVRDFSVMGGNAYLENGLHAELTEYLMNREFRPMKQVGFFDLGYDTFNFFSIFNGGVNLTHSRQVEYKANGITRKYYKFQGLRSIFSGRGAYRAVEEDYVPEVRARPQGYDNRDINLFKPEEYRKVSNLVLNPQSNLEPDGDPDDNRYFVDVFFRGPGNSRNTIYRNVLPLYGWGDWRKVPARWSTNPTRRQDITNAIHLDGVTYVHGDVFLEGWYEGIGTLVVQGNVYVGGDVLGLPPAVTGYPSLANLVVLEDPAREPFGGADRFNKTTGRVIFKPHHDMDYDRRRLQFLRELTPNLDMAIYAQNGLDEDKTSILDQFVNMEIEFNLTGEMFDFQRLPHDLVIYGTDPKDILRGIAGHRGQTVFYNPQISSEILSWEEETPST